MPKFKKGDIVQLKSGGPAMTVDHPMMAHNNKVRLRWFAGSKMDSAEVDEEALEPYTPPAKP